MSRNAGRHDSRRFPRPPEKSAGIAPPLPPAPVQAEWIAELRLIHGFAASLLFFWRARIDPAVLGRFAAWSAPGLNKKLRQELAQADDLAEAASEVPYASPGILEAATRWYVGLRLPRTRLELWSGPPIRERHRHDDPHPVSDGQAGEDQACP